MSVQKKLYIFFYLIWVSFYCVFPLLFSYDRNTVATDQASTTIVNTKSCLTKQQNSENLMLETTTQGFDLVLINIQIQKI